MTTFEAPSGGGPWAPVTDAVKERAHLFNHNHEALQRACSDGSIPPGSVLLLADANDTMGSALESKIDPDGYARRIAGPGQIPTLLVALPHGLVIALMFDKPRTAQALRLPVPEGKIPVLVIAAEGVSFLHMVLTAQPAAAEA